MTEAKVTLPSTTGLKRPALSSSSVSVIASTTSGPSIPASVVATKAFGGPITIPDLTRSRKQPNPVKQPSITPLAAPPQVDPLKPKPLSQPPPLIPTKQSANSEHSYAAQPVVTNEVSTDQAAKKNGERAKSSSDSSSDDSSSESSSSSGEESEKDEKVAKKPTQAAPPQQVTPTVPQKRGRGRPRKYPRPESATPQPTKATKEGGKEHKSRTTPRKRASARMPKPPELFSPNLVSTGVGTGTGTEDGKGTADLPKKRGRGCGACPGCLRDDCGKCTYCLDKTKFGGPGKKKQRCALRVCSNFVKAVNSPGSSRRLAVALTATSGDTPSLPRSEVTPMSKLTNQAKVVQVIEQLKQNLSAVPTMEKESTSVITSSSTPAKTTSVAASKPMPLKATPSVVASTIVSDAAVAGSSTPPSTTTVVVTASPPTPPTTVPPVLSESKTSEIALRTRRKQQQKEKEPVEEKTDRVSDAKMKCIQCGRERKLGMVRSDKFCTQRCMNLWEEANGEKQEEEEEMMEVDTSGNVTQQKKVARALKHLQIDMAFQPSAKPTMTTTPTPTATTAANKRPTASTGMQPAAAKKTKDADNSTGTKRASQQPPAQKKAKEDTPKSVSFNLIPTSTVDPISAPPLSRTVPPPSISIVPLDQLTALGTALFTQQQKKTKEGGKANSKIPEGLPVDVRSWTIPQVVKFFESTSDCKDYASVFREQEVDGTALLLLTHESLVKCLGIKLGRALKIMVHVEELQKLYSQ